MKGQWKADMMNGEGILRHFSGITYTGLWSNNQPLRKLEEWLSFEKHCKIVIFYTLLRRCHYIFASENTVSSLFVNISYLDIFGNKNLSNSNIKQIFQSFIKVSSESTLKRALRNSLELFVS